MPFISRINLRCLAVSKREVINLTALLGNSNFLPVNNNVLVEDLGPSFHNFIEILTHPTIIMATLPNIASPNVSCYRWQNLNFSVSVSFLILHLVHLPFSTTTLCTLKLLETDFTVFMRNPFQQN